MSKTSKSTQWQISEFNDTFVEKHLEAWYDLLNNSVEKNTFLAPWFARFSFELFKQKPLIVTIFSDDKLIGLLPVQPDLGYAKLPIKFYKSAIHYHQFLGTPLVRQNYEEQFSKVIFDWIDSLPKTASLFFFNLISDETSITKAMELHAHKQSRPYWVSEKISRAAVWPKPTHAPNKEATGKTRHKNIERRRKELEKLGQISVERLSDLSQLKSWYDDFLHLENNGWKKDKGTSIQQNEPDKLFFYQMLLHGLKQDQLNFFRLKIDNKSIAYTVDILTDEFVYCLRCAHDMDYRKYGPGALLEYEGYKFYRAHQIDYIVDSCTAPNNQMLNKIFPDRKKISSIAVGKRNFLHKVIFKLVKQTKLLLNCHQ